MRSAQANLGPRSPRLLLPERSSGDLDRGAPRARFVMQRLKEEAIEHASSLLGRDMVSALVAMRGYAKSLLHSNVHRQPRHLCVVNLLHQRIKGNFAAGNVIDIRLRADQNAPFGSLRIISNVDSHAQKTRDVKKNWRVISPALEVRHCQRIPSDSNCGFTRDFPSLNRRERDFPVSRFERVTLKLSINGQRSLGRIVGPGCAVDKQFHDASPLPRYRAFVGVGEQPALRILPAGGGGEFSARVAINRLGFGHPTNHGVEAGLLTGGMQFLDKPDNELQLYRGTDLRLGNVDGEIAAAALTSDAIEVYVSGLADDVKLNVSTGRVGERSRSVMPSRYEWLKGQPVIAVALGFVASIVGAVGLLLSAAGAIPPFSRWLHRLVGEER
jgi:hypothetical protein